MYFGPMFIRTGRLKVPVVYAADQMFEIGKAIQLVDGSDVTIDRHRPDGGGIHPRRRNSRGRRHLRARDRHAHH